MKFLYRNLFSKLLFVGLDICVTRPQRDKKAINEFWET